MRFRFSILLAVVGAVLLTGCAETKVYKSYRDEIDSWSYSKRFGIVWKDWTLDFLDMFSAEVGAGECIGFTVQPTELAQGGFFFGRVLKVGYRDRSFGFYDEIRKEGGLTWFYYRDVIMKPIVGTRTLMDDTCRPRVYQGFPIRHNKEWHWLDLGGEVGVIFFNASAHASPKQALDFTVNTLSLPLELAIRPLMTLAGLRMPEIDFCDDDTAAEVRKKYDMELIYDPEGLVPIEYFNERMEQAY